MKTSSIATGLFVALCASTANAEPPAGQCAGSFEAAQTHRADGKLIDARRELTACSARSCPGPIVDKCVTWLEEVDAELPSIVIAVRDADGTDVLAVRVTRDGEEIASTLDGRPIPLDPGKHSLRLHPTGHAPVAIDVIVRAGEKNKAVQVELPAPLLDATSLDPMPPSLIDPEPTLSPPRDAASDDTASDGTIHPLAWVGFGLAGVGVLAGGITGGIALGKQSELEDQCVSSGCSADEIDEGRTIAHISTASFAVAGAGAVLGVIALLASLGGEDSDTAVVPVVSPGFTGVNVRF